MEISSYHPRVTQSEVFIDWDEKECKRNSRLELLQTQIWNVDSFCVTVYTLLKHTEIFQLLHKFYSFLIWVGKHGIPTVLRRLQIKEMTESSGKWPWTRKPMVRQTFGSWRKKVGQTRWALRRAAGAQRAPDTETLPWRPRWPSYGCDPAIVGSND